jgi:crotonobetainyl-CoA:carnitine CoA-transferase CaiB-like acyl-CoA transferase
VSLPLNQLRVIEFGNLVAAPYCGMLLADLGADVIKVEPLAGDLARAIGPFYGEESAFFISVNRGKRSLAIDARVSTASRVLRRLCLEADVLIHNLRAGAMERMGLAYDDLAPEAQHLVYASISAFGATGPDAGRSGIDLIFQGESGMMSIAGEEGDPPQKTATTIADFVAGTNAALAITAAIAGGGGEEGAMGSRADRSTFRSVTAWSRFRQAGTLNISLLIASHPRRGQPRR